MDECREVRDSRKTRLGQTSSDSGSVLFVNVSTLKGEPYCNLENTMRFIANIFNSSLCELEQNYNSNVSS
jgi:hypothetical protein